MEGKKLSKSEKNLLLNMFAGAVEVSECFSEDRNLFLLTDYQGKKMFCWLQDRQHLSYSAIYTDRNCFSESQQSFFLQDHDGKEFILSRGRGLIKFTDWLDEIYESVLPTPFVLCLIAEQKIIVRLPNFSISKEIPDYFEAKLLDNVAKKDFYLCTFRDGEQAILKLSTLQLSLKTSFSQITVIPEYGIQLSLRNGVKALLSFSSFSLSPWQF